MQMPRNQSEASGRKAAEVENFDKRIALGMAFLVSGALVLFWTGRPSLSGIAGPLAVVAACIAWGIDNNLSRKVSLSDPIQIVHLRGLVAGPINLALGFFAGGPSSGNAAGSGGNVCWLPRVRRQPHLLRTGPASPRECPHRRLFLDGAIPRHHRCDRWLQRSTDLADRRGRCTNGRRGLAASDRTSRA
jgi:hypothetical protein